MATPLSIPGIYQDVQEVVANNVDFMQLDFSDLPLGNVLRIQNVTGDLGVTPFATAPTIKASIGLIGGSDGGQLALIPGEAVLIPPAHGRPISIPLTNTVTFYTDSRPSIRIFFESSVSNAIALFTITGELIPTI